MPKLLLLNTIINPTPSRAFDEYIAPRLGGWFGHPWQIAHLSADEPLPAPGSFSHLIVSGSELSAAERNPRDNELEAMLRDFVEKQRCVFGICYGHQMLARALTGSNCCRKARTPEFGWKRLKLGSNRIFDGIADLVTVHSHYDEVFDLGPSFHVIAKTDDCAIQAFAYEEQPVWGTQFHPEQPLRLGRAMLASNLRTEPRAAELFVDDLEHPDQLLAADRMFHNFFRELPP